MSDAAWAFWDNHGWAAIAFVAALIATVSILADRRRARRSRIDDVGFMPWTGITVFSMLVTLVAAALELKLG